MLFLIRLAGPSLAPWHVMRTHRLPVPWTGNSKLRQPPARCVAWRGHMLQDIKCRVLLAVQLNTAQRLGAVAGSEYAVLGRQVFAVPPWQLTYVTGGGA